MPINGAQPPANKKQHSARLEDPGVLGHTRLDGVKISEVVLLYPLSSWESDTRSLLLVIVTPAPFKPDKVAALVRETPEFLALVYREASGRGPETEA